MHVETTRTRIVLERPDGHVLALVRNFLDRLGYDWMSIQMPGGGIDEGEDALQALIREIREELGLELDPKTVRLLYVYRETREADAVEKAVWPGCTTITNHFIFFNADVTTEAAYSVFLAEPHKFKAMEWIPPYQVATEMAGRFGARLGDGISEAMANVQGRRTFYRSNPNVDVVGMDARWAAQWSSAPV
jgi:8-oxo-dGTP pyrophosphatase MutT (NUDIX family)